MPPGEMHSLAPASFENRCLDLWSTKTVVKGCLRTVCCFSLSCSPSQVQILLPCALFDLHNYHFSETEYAEDCCEGYVLLFCAENS